MRYGQLGHTNGKSVALKFGAALVVVVCGVVALPFVMGKQSYQGTHEPKAVRGPTRSMWGNMDAKIKQDKATPDPK